MVTLHNIRQGQTLDHYTHVSKAIKHSTTRERTRPIPVLRCLIQKKLQVALVKTGEYGNE